MSKTINLKKIIIIIINIVLIALFTNISLAANNYSCRIDLQPNKNQVSQGDTVIYEIKASQINAGNGIVLFSAYVDYDANSFDCRIEGDDEGNWNKMGEVDNYITMTRSDYKGTNSDQTIAKIILTAKANASSGVKSVGLKNISLTVADEDESFPVQDIYSNITVGAISNTDNNNNNNNNNNGSIFNNDNGDSTPNNNNNNGGTILNNNNNNNGGTNLNNNNNNNGGTNLNNSNSNGQLLNNSNNQNNNSGSATQKSTNKNKESNTDIPQTGTNEAIVMTVFLLVVGLAIIFYKKYNTWRDI